MVRVETTTEVLGYTLDTYHMFSPDTYLSGDTEIEDYEIDFEGYKKGLAELAENILINNLSEEEPIVKDISIGKVISPNEYNFKTDNGDVNVEVDLENLTKYLIDNREEFEAYIKERFTSYDGFISFVENQWFDFMDKYNGTDEQDKHLHRGVALGWYMNRELMSVDEYYERMWEDYGEVIHNNLTSIIYIYREENEDE